MYSIIAPLGDIPMFYIKYIAVNKMHMHAGTVSKNIFTGGLKR